MLAKPNVGQASSLPYENTIRAPITRSRMGGYARCLPCMSILNSNTVFHRK